MSRRAGSVPFAPPGGTATAPGRGYAPVGIGPRTRRINDEPDTSGRTDGQARSQLRDRGKRARHNRSF